MRKILCIYTCSCPLRLFISLYRSIFTSLITFLLPEALLLAFLLWECAADEFFCFLYFWRSISPLFFWQIFLLIKEFQVINSCFPFRKLRYIWGDFPMAKREPSVQKIRGNNFWYSYSTKNSVCFHQSVWKTLYSQDIW